MASQSQAAAPEVVRNARRAKGLTQAELAAEVGCTQSAVSMFESGRTGALSADVLGRIGKALGIEIKAEDKAGRHPAQTLTTLKYCPVDDCPSNVPYVVSGQLCFRPCMVEARAAEPTRCGFCGEILESRCPNRECAAELREGGFCPCCGTPYVTATQPDRGGLVPWADAQRARIREIKALSETARPRSDFGG